MIWSRTLIEKLVYLLDLLVKQTYENGEGCLTINETSILEGARALITRLDALRLLRHW